MMLSSSAVDRVCGYRLKTTTKLIAVWTPGVRPPRATSTQSEEFRTRWAAHNVLGAAPGPAHVGVRPSGCRGGSPRRGRAAPGRRSVRCDEGISIGRLEAGTDWLRARDFATSRDRRRSG